MLKWSAMRTRDSIIERLIDPRRGSFSPEHARYVLSLDFAPADQARCAKLSRKASLGKLSEKEAAELDEFLAANAILASLQSKARTSLRKTSSAA
jgi:hypothetical protein